MIYIDIAKAHNLPGLNNLFISFSSYQPRYIEVLRKLKNRKYDEKAKTWEVPDYKLQEIIEAFADSEITITTNIEHQALSGIPNSYKFKTEPYDHQKVGIEYGLNHPSYLLADDMGLGKTKQICDLACVRKLRGEISHCLIICGVNGLKYNWLREIQTHTNESARILGTRYTKRDKKPYIGSTADKIEDVINADEFFLITNIETLISREFTDACCKRFKDTDMMVVDEIHKGGNTTSRRGSNMQRLSCFRYKVALSGTPIVNNPIDAYGILKWLGIENSTLTAFKNFYCEFGGFGGTELLRYRNLDKLRHSIDAYMIRRLKDEVIDLPPKIHQIEYVEMSNAQLRIYQEARQWTLDNIDLISRAPNPLSQLLRMRQATGDTSILSSTVHESCKLDRLEELVSDIVADNKKCLVFSNWTSMTTPIMQRLAKYKPALITGEVDASTRQMEQDRFQLDPECHICVGTTGAMGTGITLTAASYVIFVDSPWHSAAKLQAEDRAYRIGTNHSVNIITLVCKDTIDERIEDLIAKKQEMSDFLVDGLPFKVNSDLLMSLVE